MNTLMVLGVAVVLGMQRATEADHLAAVATLVGRERSLAQGLRHGAAWGPGHALTLMLVAGGFALLDWVISPELAGRFEQGVGAMLITLGGHLCWRTLHGSQTAQARVHGVTARSLPVGMVHGLAGSAALALLVSQTMPAAQWQIAYVALFGAGSLLGMALLSSAVVLSMRLTGCRLGPLHQAFNLAIAAVSVLVGLRLLLALE